MSQRVHGGQGRVDPTQHHNGEITPTSYERADVRIQVDSTFGAAYRLGVALNELRFFAIQAFLLDRQYVMANCLTSGTVAAALLGAVEEPIAQDYALGLERNAHASLSSALLRTGTISNELVAAQSGCAIGRNVRNRLSIPARISQHVSTKYHAGSWNSCVRRWTHCSMGSSASCSDSDHSSMN